MHRAHPRLFSVSLAALIAGGLAFSAPAMGGSADFYLKFDSVEGAVDPSPASVIEIQAWSWGASNPVSTHVGGGMGAGKANMQDISSVSGAKGAPKAVSHDLRTNVVARTAPAGDVDGDGADIVSPRDPATGLATGKRQHKPMARAAPPSSAAGSLTTLVPAGMCKMGASYPSAELGTPGRVYRLEGVTVAGCAAAASSGDRPMESISLNYAKIQW